MKKLLGILVLGLLWCNVGVAGPIILNCEPLDKKNRPRSFIIDEKNKDVVFDGMEYLYKNRNKNGLMFDKYEISFVDNFIRFKIILNKITGVLKYLDHDIKNS